MNVKLNNSQRFSFYQKNIYMMWRLFGQSGTHHHHIIHFFSDIVLKSHPHPDETEILANSLHGLF